MSKQLYDTGDVIHAGSLELEVVSVSYQEVDGEKVKFAYTVRPHAELEEERRQEVELAKALEVQEKENAKLAGTSLEDATLDESKVPEAAKSADESVEA